MLALLLILSIGAIAAMRYARLELSLASRAALEAQAFALAASAIERSLDKLTGNPLLLDEATSWTLAEDEPGTGGSYKATTGFAGSDDTCPVADAIPMRRLFFETRATGRAGEHAVSHQAQGFFLCRSIATETPGPDGETTAEPCDACDEFQVETLPVRTWWTVLEDVP